MTPIADLHCDLLCYLEEKPFRSPYDKAARCSIPQLKAGYVKLQTLAIFTETHPFSVKKGLAQARLYQNLEVSYLQDVKVLRGPLSWPFQTDHIHVLAAFENASGFCDEQEPLKQGFNRLGSLIQGIGRPLYISLTWNTENRFGGGALTGVGLKEDGKRLLEELNEKRIAVDLSHASDALAYEVIDYIENKGLAIPLMASHSNARAITSVPRNLPADIAKEIFKRKGVIGLNLYRPFVGDHEEDILNHLAYWLELGGDKHICLGADFFYEADFPSLYQPGSKDLFFKSYQDAASYPALLEFVRRELKLKESVIVQLAHKNLVQFLKEQVGY